MILFGVSLLAVRCCVTRKSSFCCCISRWFDCFPFRLDLIVSHSVWIWLCLPFPLDLIVSSIPFGFECQFMDEEDCWLLGLLPDPDSGPWDGGLDRGEIRTNGWVNESFLLIRNHSITKSNHKRSNHKMKSHKMKSQKMKLQSVVNLWNLIIPIFGLSDPDQFIN